MVQIERGQAVFTFERVRPSDDFVLCIRGYHGTPNIIVHERPQRESVDERYMGSADTQEERSTICFLVDTALGTNLGESGEGIIRGVSLEDACERLADLWGPA